MATAPAPARRSFQTLDGLRGVGALLIVIRHNPALFGPLRVPESFLAVDLFYLVSGFVIAHAYGERLARGGFVWDFFKTRLVRLYPLYFVGLLCGVAMAAAQILQVPHTPWNVAKVAECFALGLIMFPRLPILPDNGSTLNGPVWTLLPELIANMVYAATIRLLTWPVLVGVIVVCGGAVVTAELVYGTLDVGYNLTDQWAALARVGFSFFAGVAVYRLIGTREFKSLWLAWLCMALLAVVLGVTIPPKNVRTLYEIGMVLLGMPLIAIGAALFEPDRLSGRLFSFVGLISYGVYLIHQPLGNLVATELRLFWRLSPQLWFASVGFAFMASMLLFAWLLDRFYDAPMRAWLRPRLFPPRPART
jgi:peptidoglycan/LPS O-acetylase OafA/YrhL